MAKISTYPIISIPTLNDLLIGTDVEDINNTKNFSLGDIASLIVTGNYVPYIGATQNVDLGSYGITSDYFAVGGGLSSQFLKADGSLDSTVYQAAGNYITGLTGQATASGPGIATVTLSNSAVIGKVLTGLTITGGSISSTDSILQAFGKLQNQVNSLYGGAVYQGTWNASTNTPTLTSGVGTQGWYYIVNVAGSTNLDGITDWNVGDWAIFDGTAWQQVDNTDTVVSVNGQVGVVVLTTTNISEGTNLYFTNARARSAISLTTTGNSGVSTYNNITGVLNIPDYTLSGLGGVPTTRTLTINGTAYDLSANRTWSVGTVTSVGTSAPLTGGTITGSGTIGITQAGILTDGYLSSTDWNTFNNKQNALTNPVTGTGTVYYLPMWSGVSALTDSIISYSSNTVTYNYNSSSGGTVNYTNTNGTTYTYTIQMNNTGSPRQTYHSYTDGNVLQQINSNVVSKNLQSGQLVLPYYNSTTAFSGTVAGYLGFDSSGNILTFAGPSLTGYVPYTGATTDVDLGEYGISAGYFQADITPTQVGAVGRLIWNDQDGTLNLGLKGGTVTLKVGEQEYARVVNGTGGNVLRANYQVVKIIGAQGQRIQVGLAKANNDANSKDTLGLIAENINNNNEGFVIVSGLIEDLNTTGSLQGETWSDGDTLYLSGTTFGQLTNIKPIAPIHTVIVGFVVHAHITQGKIFVKVDNGYELEELHDVNPLPYVNNGVLYRDTSVNLWKSATIPTVLGYTPVNQAGDTMTGYLILNADPVTGLGAATKDYVDSLVNGIDWKQAANAGTVASLPSYVVSGSGQVLTGSVNGAIPSATTDGVTLVAGNRVLVKNETSTLTPNNGIYVVTQVGSASLPFILTRSSDANTSALLSEATLSIAAGTTLSNTQWHCNPAATPIVIGTTYITFSQIGSGVYFGTAPIYISGNLISISQSNTSTDGYLSNTDWNTFNNKQSTITLTTTGSSGSSTFISNTLNVPTYTLSGLGGVPEARTLTINGTAYDLSVDRSWSVGTVTSVAALTLGTSGTDLSSIVATGTTTPVITLNVPTASATNRGALSSTDWSTFNGKQNAITLTTTGTSGAATLIGATLNIPQYQSVLTNPVTGTGTTNEIAYWISSSAIGSLTTATYPSLTELSYVKGVTSSIQTQINGKQDTLTLTTTGTSGAATLVGSTLNIPQYSGGGGGGMSIGGTVTSGTTGSILFIGSGPVLAQDNANFFWDDTNNYLGIGTSSPVSSLTITTASTAIPRGLTIHQTSSDTNAGLLTMRKSRGAGAAVNGDNIGNWFADAYDGTQYTSGARIRFAIDAAVSNGVVPTAFQIFTGSSGNGTQRLNVSSSGIFTFSSQIVSTLAGSTTTGGGQIYLNGATSNRIDFNSNGFAAPAFTTRSAGTKITLFPVVDATNVDYAIGIEANTLWNSIPQATNTFQYKWYAGTTNIMTLNGIGQMTLATNQNATTSFTISNTTSGTASQAQAIFTSDATAGSANIGKKSNTFTTSGIINLADFAIVNATKGDIAILNNFASGAIKFAAGASSVAQATLTASGILLIGTTTPIGSELFQVSGRIRAIDGTFVGGGTNIGVLESSGYNLTGTSVVSMLSLDGTWNTTGNPTAIFLNITNTASGATSKLIDLQIGSASKFNIAKTGQMVLGGYTSTSSFSGTAAGYLAFDSSGNILTVASPGGTTIGYTIPFASNAEANFTWADATVYYIGMGPALNLATVQGRNEMFVPKTGTLKAAYVTASFSTAGSAESWTMSILINGTTATTISSTATSATTRNWSNNALSISVTAGDTIEIQSSAVTWATNPVSNAGYGLNGIVYIE